MVATVITYYYLLSWIVDSYLCVAIYPAVMMITTNINHAVLAGVYFIDQHSLGLSCIRKHIANN